MADELNPDDAEVQLTAVLGGLPLEQARYLARVKRAQQLANYPMARGAEVGRTYVASSPLEHLATAMSRIRGNREWGQADQDVARTLQQQQLGQAWQVQQQAEMKRRDMEQKAAQDRALLDLKNAEAMSKEARDAAEAKYRQQQLDVEKQKVNQDQWVFGQDATGGGFLYNRKTKQVERLSPAGTPGPAAAPGTPGVPVPIPGKPTEQTRNKAATSNASILKLDLAISALDRAPGAYGGATNFAAGVADSVGGTPVQSLTSRRLSKEELRAKNYISNVVSQIINERAGANVTYREELRQKFLPQETDSLEAAKAKLEDMKVFELANIAAMTGQPINIDEVFGGGSNAASPAAGPATAPVRSFKRVNGKLVEVKP